MFRHPQWLEPVGSFGWTGVDLFFVLSGYLMGHQLLQPIADRRPVSVTNFYIKRFFRIIPVYLLVLIVYATLPGLRESAGMQPLWKFATFTENLGFDGSLGRAFSHAWSLCVEEHFYLVFPLLVVGLSFWKIGRGTAWIAAALLIAGIAIRVFLWHGLVKSDDAYGPWYCYIYYPTYSRLDGLLVGVCVAATQCFAPALWQRLTGRPSLILVIGAVLLFVACSISQNRLGLLASAVSFPLVAVAYGFIVIAAVSPRSALHRVRLRVTGFVAAVSYSLYLIHKVLIHVTQPHLAGAHVNIDGTLVFLVCTATSLAAAWTLHICVERPFMRVRSRILARRGRSLGRLDTVRSAG